MESLIYFRNTASTNAHVNELGYALIFGLLVSTTSNCPIMQESRLPVAMNKDNSE